MRNIAIFWDLDNTYLTIQEQFGAQEQYILELIDKVHERFKADCIRIFRAYADFEKIRKVQSTIQKKRVTPKHVFSSNSGSDSRKNASDIELCLDAIETAIVNNDITDIVIISADKDMIPLMHKLKFYGKCIHLIYLEAAIAEDKLVLGFADELITIESLISLTKADPDGLTEGELDTGCKDAIRVVSDFYERNKEKPALFCGIRMYKEDMINKKGYSGTIADKILQHCIDIGLLSTEDIGGNKTKIVVKQFSMVE